MSGALLFCGNLPGQFHAFETLAGIRPMQFTRKVNRAYQ